MFRYLTFIIISIVLVSCAGVHLTKKLIFDDKDWIMSGGSSLQQNIAPVILEPPLKLKWRYNMDAGIGTSAISVSDGVVFANSLQGEMHSIDISTGGKLGLLDFLGQEAATTPLILNNIIVLSYTGSSASSLTAYNLLTGFDYWSKNYGDFQSSPVLFNSNIYIGSLNGTLYKINSNSGNIIWQYDSHSAIRANSSVSGNKVLFHSDNVTLTCIDTSDSSVLWKFNTKKQTVSPVLIKEQKVYFGSYDSNYYCLDLNNGQELWKKNLSTKISSGSSFYKNSVIFTGVNGNVYSLNSENGDINWKFKTKGVILSTPIVSGNNVYFTSYDEKLYCLDANNAFLKWSYDLESKSKTSPVIWGNFLLTASDYYIYCFNK